MTMKWFEIDREGCNEAAHQIFLETSGINRKTGKKFERMAQDAYRMRQAIEKNVEIRIAYRFFDRVDIDGKTAVIGGETLHCSAFEQIDPKQVKGAYVYALAVGDFGLPDEPIMDQLYADIWGSAFTDAARFQLRDALMEEAALSDSFGPGFYGMDVSEMATVAKLLDFGALNIEVRNSRIILPLKSCAGLYFSVTEDYEPLGQECENCLGTHSSCKLCQVHGGR